MVTWCPNEWQNTEPIMVQRSVFSAGLHHHNRKHWARLKHLYFGAALLKKTKKRTCLYAALLTQCYMFFTLFANWYVTCINVKITCKTGKSPKKYICSTCPEWRVATDSFPCVSRMVHNPKDIQPTWHHYVKHWSQHWPATLWNSFDTLWIPCLRNWRGVN